MMAGSGEALHSRDDKLVLARRQFFEAGVAPEEGVVPVILRSWERCRRKGLVHAANESLDPASRAKLSESRERSAGLLEQAGGIMEHLFAQIRSSGSMVILADIDGMIIHSLGDPDFVDRAGRIALQPGACWNEDSRGTNAIGTAIAERTNVEVLGAEHYLDRNSFLTCTASPVFNGRGDLVGIFDISGDYRSHQRHTLGLVRLSVQLLEKRLFEAEFANELIIAFHSRPEYLGSLQEALVAVSPEGCILGTNQAARDWFASVGGGAPASFGSLFRTRFGAMLDRAAAHSARDANHLLKLDLRNGGEIYVQVRGGGKLLVNAGVSAIGSDKDGVTSGRRQARPCDRSEGRITLECMDTGDPRQHMALERARRIQGKDIPLLIQGESGVGKELFARAFHNSGPRADGPFVALNCAAIPETLIESELFGYCGGAFTGARKEGAQGKIQQASGGTLFLDEIGDMPLSMQARLLRVLQERSVTPVGSLRSIPVDISLVCATHRMLRDAVAHGLFREDLYYRVNGLTVTLPPLRDRKDIRCLVENILGAEVAGSRSSEVVIGEEVMRFFEQYAWPGNIRQLQNVIRVSVALLDDDECEIQPVHLPEELFGLDPMDSTKDHAAGARTGHAVMSDLSASAVSHISGSAGQVGQGQGGPRSLDEIELEAIATVMREVGGNVSAAARRLGVSRNTLYRKLGRIQ